MAIMIPDSPREYTPASLEGEMFEALRKLPDKYYIVHSFKNIFVQDNTLYEGETDFLIFNPDYGIICLEAKAGNVYYKDGKWYYSKGIEMRHGGPYNQAANNKWDLINSIKQSSLKDILKRCKVLHAVWFPSVKKDDFLKYKLPSEGDKNITLTLDSINNPEEDLKRIFNLKLEYDVQTRLSEKDVKDLFREVICPECNLVPTNNFMIEIKKISFKRLLQEQYVLLNYLAFQRTAVINGAAGTGKTMIAVEKAKRHASVGERVLFLCYNALLKDYLTENYNHDNIDYMTIASFACKLCRTQEPDYVRADGEILEMAVNGRFPYQHIIVDEGQDFGSEKIEETNILQTLHDIVVDASNKKGTFYIFYDALQLVQSRQVPHYIANADCKLTLYKNCRNTVSIATTSLKPISERDPELFDGAVKGSPAKIHFVPDKSDEPSKIFEIIDDIKNEGFDSIVILTCETESKSVLAGHVSKITNGNIQFTSCRKFKGLEADAVILVDVNENTFMGNGSMRFYVGASRARIRLDIVTSMNDEQCTHILESVLHYQKKIKNPKKNLSLALNAVPAG